MVSIEHRGHVALVKLDRGVTNALNLEIIDTLAKAVREVKRDSDVRSVVLGSANEKFFCIGFDIPQLFELDRESFRRFFQAFNQTCLELYSLPKPAVAAVSGHAIAGGCILALCCDYRFIAAGHKLMGLNEVKLGVPVPYLADCVLRQLVGVRKAREIMDLGELYAPETSLQLGMVDRVLPLDEVLSQAIEQAELLGGMPAEAMAMHKDNRVESVKSQVLKGQEAREQAFLDCWYSAETRRRLREAMEKF